MTSVVALPGPPQHTVPYSHSPIGSVDGRLGSTTSPDTASDDRNVPRGDVTAKLNFYSPPADGTVPFYFVEEPPEGQPQRNFSDAEHEVVIHDARGKESSFELDRHAFAVLASQHSSPDIDWDDDASVKSLYYPEVEKLLLENIGGSPNRVLLFDHTVRRAQPNAHRAPVTRAHIDQTPKSAEMRVEFHVPSEAREIISTGVRYRIINVWRPLNGQVESFPLAFANSETVLQDDMVGVEHRYPDRTGETAAIRFNEQHEWYYVSGIKNDERVLLQCFDSDFPQNRVPHSAFVDPRSSDASKPRESIEVRALIFG